ncbi:hypothetical protein H6P81_007168 [Aristolochia fimbriata]|uniref:Uncharacterized protein n=1 Tax=Aristolochia fimbriata TaxID=158543 RepID=A0AAV7F0I3_ARIFI|nr:hypothetical protein H6P81_007168 [Aristolochia fimbriata]
MANNVSFADVEGQLLLVKERLQELDKLRYILPLPVQVRDREYWTEKKLRENVTDVLDKLPEEIEYARHHQEKLQEFLSSFPMELEKNLSRLQEEIRELKGMLVPPGNGAPGV